MRHLLLFSTMLSACADKDWRAALEADSSRVFLTYAQTHPDTAHAAAALRRAEDLAWDEAVAANTSVAFDGFRASWPQSERAPVAATRAEVLAWDEAVAAASTAAWTTFLARYPASPRRSEAEARLEEAVFDGARKEATEQSWGRYLLRYPDGKHAPEAGAARERIGWELAAAQDTPAAYRDFLRKYEGGTHTAAAHAWLDATLVSSLQPVVVLVGTWQNDKIRPTLLTRYKAELDKGLVATLKREFTVSPTLTVDAAKTPWAHPHTTFPPVADQGLLVLELTERQGRRFDPSGYATDIDARLSLYTPGTRTPVVSEELHASTPAKIRGTDESALHTTAVTELGQVLLPLADSLAAFDRKVSR